MSKTQQNWCRIEKEAFAIKYALEKFDPYIHGSKVVLRSDHMPLKSLLTSPMANKKIQMWALAISSYDVQIEYIKGRLNICAYMLSRMTHPDLTPEDELKIER